MNIKGNHIEVTGALTLDTAASSLREGKEALVTVLAASDDAVFDLAAVKAVDSSGLAVVFDWARSASSAGKKAVVANVPAQMSSLAAVYGVDTLLPQA